MAYVGSIDQGTSSSRFVIFDNSGALVAQHQLEHKQYYPSAGWVEHDPLEIWENTKTCITEALESINITPHDLCSVGVTNQRETTVVWNKHTGVPYHNAVVWNCGRTAELATEFANKLGGQDALRKETGLPIVSYFSALKLVWLFRNVDGLREAAQAGDVLFGTIDSWLVWNLSGKTTHITDVTNASRTLLFNLKTMDWDEKLLKVFDIPANILPSVKCSSTVLCRCEKDGVLDQVAVAGILGDQQAALFGQACYKEGEAKCTYGTGCFLMMNTGPEPMASHHGLLTTVAYQLEGQPPVYALEGAVSVCGSLVQWLRDQLQIIESAKQTQDLVQACGPGGSEGLVVVPAFSGLFAPYWREDARGVICGLTAFHEKKHMVKACLEAASFQAMDVLDAMAKDAGHALANLKVDGGMSANDGVLQFQSDISRTPVSRPLIMETTALGAAYAAGLAVGFWEDTDELEKQWKVDTFFEPSMKDDQRDGLLNNWRKAIQRSMNWIEKKEEPVPKPSTSIVDDTVTGTLSKSPSNDNYFDDGLNTQFHERSFFDEDDGEDKQLSDSSSTSSRKNINAAVSPLLLIGFGVLAGVITSKLLSRS